MTKKNRSGGLVAVVAAATVIGIVLGAPKCSTDEPTGPAPVEVTKTTTETPKRPAVPRDGGNASAAPSRKPHYVIVDKGAVVPNIEPPTKLWIRGLTAAECPEWGGTFDGSTGLCRNVDY